jgi:hypothetical protein
LKDLTDRMAIFREAARHLWNTALAQETGWNVRDDFDEACNALFRAIVLRPIDKTGATPAPSSSRNGPPIPFLRVVPGIEHGTPIHINRAVPASGYWDHPMNAVGPGDVDLRFVRFFDWDELGRREFELVETVIRAFPKHPALVGRAALLAFSQVKIVLEA